MPEPYEYKPPHGSYPPLHTYSVTIPFGSELIQREVKAENEQKAFRKVAMEIAQKTGLLPKVVFSRIVRKDCKIVLKANTFIMRACSVADSSCDIERIERLPHVETVQVSADSDENIKKYRVVLGPQATSLETREVTGYLQNLFGERLRSSNPALVTLDNSTREGVEVRVAVFQIPT